MRFTALIFAFISTAALAQGPAPDDLVRARCDKDGCSEFRLLGKETMRVGQDGTLFRTRIQQYHASHSGRTGGETDTGYAYCSLTRPAVLASNNGKTKAFMVAPFSEEPAWQQRKHQNFIALYFTACHGTEAGRAAVQNLRAVAQRFGYSVPAATSRMVDLARVEDIAGAPPAVASGPVAGVQPLPPAPVPEPALPPRERSEPGYGLPQALSSMARHIDRRYRYFLPDEEGDDEIFVDPRR